MQLTGPWALTRVRYVSGLGLGGSEAADVVCMRVSGWMFKRNSNTAPPRLVLHFEILSETAVNLKIRFAVPL